MLLVMQPNESEICREIAELHDNIIAAGIIQNQELIARFSKVKDPPASSERIKLLFAQPEILISICKTNEEFFGNILYLIVCFENSDLVFFPAVLGGTQRMLYVRMERSYRGEEILQKVYEYLEKRSTK